MNRFPVSSGRFNVLVHTLGEFFLEEIIGVPDER